MYLSYKNKTTTQACSAAVIHTIAPLQQKSKFEHKYGAMLSGVGAQTL
jgi:hypothetical protein